MRSLLYVPGNSDRFLAKAHERGADALIIDLEDSVSEPEKDAARNRIADVVPAAKQNGARVLVCINGGTEREIDDAEGAITAGVDALWIPKVESAARIRRFVARMERMERSVGSGPKPIVAAIESAAGVFEARQIAKVDRVMGLNAGSEDLAASLDAEPLPEVLRVPKLLVHLAAKAERRMSFGLIDSAANFQDLDRLRAAACEARRFGFDGATCVHPSAVAVLNETFAPSEDELMRAARVVRAAHQANEAGRGAFVFEGRMVDRARALTKKRG